MDINLESIDLELFFRLRSLTERLLQNKLTPWRVSRLSSDESCGACCSQLCHPANLSLGESVNEARITNLFEGFGSCAVCHSCISSAGLRAGQGRQNRSVDFSLSQIWTVQRLGAGSGQRQGHLQKRPRVGEHGMEYSQRVRHQIQAGLDHQAVHGDSDSAIS